MPSDQHPVSPRYLSTRFLRSRDPETSANCWKVARALQFFDGQTLKHFITGRQPKDAVRLDILKDSLRMFALKPFLGWGLGTFQDVYPSFRSFYTMFFVNAATTITFKCLWKRD